MRLHHKYFGLLLLGALLGGCVEMQAMGQQFVSDSKDFFVGKPCTLPEQQRFEANLNAITQIQPGMAQFHVMRNVMPTPPSGENIFILQNRAQVDAVFYDISRRGCKWDELTEYRFGGRAPVFFVNGEVIGIGHDFFDMHVKPYLLNTNGLNRL